MANSTPFVLAAGAIVVMDKVIADGTVDFPVLAATGFSALALAGLDAIIPGTGKGVAMLGLTVVFLTRIPSIATHIQLGKPIAKVPAGVQGKSGFSKDSGSVGGAPGATGGGGSW